MKYHFKVDNHTWACMVLQVNGFGFASLILICQLLPFANGSCTGVIAGITVGYTGIE